MDAIFAASAAIITTTINANLARLEDRAAAAHFGAGLPLCIRTFDEERCYQRQERLEAPHHLREWDKARVAAEPWRPSLYTEEEFRQMEQEARAEADLLWPLR